MSEGSGSDSNAWRRLFKSSLDPVAELDSDGRFLFASDAFTSLLGYDAADLAEMSVLSLVCEEDAAETGRSIEELMRKQSCHFGPFRFRTKDGQRRTIEISATREPESGRIVTIWRDCAENAWVTAGRMNRVLEESRNEFYVFDDETLRFRMANRGACENLGYTLEELQQLTPVSIKPEFTEESFRARIADLRSGERTQLLFTTTHRRKDGSEYPVDVHLQYSPEAREFHAVIIDKTELEEHAAARLESQQRASTILDTAADAILSIREDGIIESANHATMEIFGYAHEELIGQNVKMLMPPEYAEHHDEYMRRYLETGEARIIGMGREVEGLRKDGTTFPIRLAVGEARIGDRLLFTGIIHDLSDHRALQDQLVQSQKMEAIGTLAGGVAHDFNNLLTSIRGSGELIAASLEPGHKLLRAAARIQKAADRGAELTGHLLAFSRKEVSEPKIVDANHALKEAHDLFGRIIGEHIEIRTNLDPDLGRVRVDPTQLDQVVMNLVVNAADAMPDRGELVLATSNQRLGKAAASRLGVPPGKFVVLSVADTGHGMSAEVQARIFEPFYTTKEPGKGTGLGLATVFGVVNQNNGAIAVDSEEDVGTTFSVYFPRVDAEDAEEGDSPETDSVEVSGGSETILLVEDDALLRDLATEILEGEGYHVIAADSPNAALALASEHQETLRMVITDIVMPGMSGLQLVKKLRVDHPELSVLYMSGYTDRVLEDRGALTPDAAFIRKPFSNRDLAVQVRQVLEDR